MAGIYKALSRTGMVVGATDVRHRDMQPFGTNPFIHVRLFANMFAGDMVTLVFFSLIPIGVPVIFMGLHIGVALIQTYIFMLLAMVYLGEAVAHEH